MVGCLQDDTRVPHIVVTLLLASRADSASVNLHRAVLALGSWSNAEDYSHGILHRHNEKEVHLLLIEQLHIHADALDKLHEKNCDVIVEEVLVLSRHSSKSGIPSLSVHTIGVPGEVPHGEPAFAGGLKGLAVPPSPRFSVLFKKLQEETIESGLADEFDVTLETTHHGPVLSSPTLYLEIGSTENEWDRQDASYVWAKVLSDVLGLAGGKEMGCWPGHGDVMIGFGGGHYAPRHTAVINQGNFWMGHLLANYALQFDDSNSDSLPSGPWLHAVKEVVRATRESYPGGLIFAHLDRKSFKGWQRSALINALNEIGVEIRRGKDM